MDDGSWDWFDWVLLILIADLIVTLIAAGLAAAARREATQARGELQRITGDNGWLGGAHRAPPP